MASSLVKVLIPVYPGFNALDVVGPCEVMGNFAISHAFEILIASATEHTTAWEGATLQRVVSFDDLGHASGKKAMEYDLLIVPGAPGPQVAAALADDKGLLKLIEVFASSKPCSENTKWLVSICTGAGFLGTAGVFAGKTVTTHFGYISTLEEICAAAAAKSGTEPSTTVVRKRCVDAGTTKTGVRVVTSGGVSCGIDCALWLVSKIKDLKTAEKVAGMMDYDWQFPGVKIDVTQGYIV